MQKSPLSVPHRLSGERAQSTPNGGKLHAVADFVGNRRSTLDAQAHRIAENQSGSSDRYL